jgi:NodT family efflux transporter outer membrane factor (OMF) lipoprotein
MDIFIDAPTAGRPGSRRGFETVSSANRENGRIWSMKSNLLVVSSTLCAIIVGCTVGPNYVRPKMSVPAQFSEPAGALQTTTRPASMPATTQTVSGQMEEWWKNFRDPQLDSLVERAIKSNLDLQAAEARIRQARAQYGIAVSAEFPTANATAGFTRSRASKGVVRSSSNLAGSPTITATTLYQAGFDSSWEIDVFGGNRRNIEAAQGDIEASVEDRRNVLVTLLSEVAKDYIDYRGFARQIAIAVENVKAQRETLAVTRKQFEAGLKTATELDVRRAEALVFSTESQIPALEIFLRQTAHALAILLAKDPTALMQELEETKPIPSAIIPEVPIGLPSDLLRRRPDVRRSERQLAAATARIGVAVAQLFPKFSLVGSLGLESTKFKHITSIGSNFWSFGPSVSWPILDWGKIRSTIRVENALQEQAFILYEQTVLLSLQEVEDALTAYSREQVRRQMLTSSVEANQRAVTLATQRYTAGLTDFLSVLDAERSLYAAEDQLVQSNRAVSEDLVALYKALGGGWEATEARAE